MFIAYNMEALASKYQGLCATHSDINEHLPTLYKYAKECNRILETGVRGCVSSWALAYGLLNPVTHEAGGHTTPYLFMNDIEECDIGDFLACTQNLNIQVEYQWINNLDLSLNEPVDMVFIDTWHIYGQLKRELAKFAPFTTKYILMHDTTIDEVDGESVRFNSDVEEQSQKSGIPVDEIRCGLGKAIDEFLQNNPEWKLKDKFTNNNGLTVLERVI